MTPPDQSTVATTPGTKSPEFEAPGSANQARNGNEPEWDPPTGGIGEKLLRFILGSVIPIVIIAAGVMFVQYMIANRPEVESSIPEVPAPLVRVLPVEMQTYQYIITSEGTVTPRTESQLVAEISGKITNVSENFTAGGFVRKGERLVTIDPTDYQLAITQARQNVASAKTALESERAQAELARREWEDLGGSETPSPLTLREPQLEQAQATLDAAEATLQQARRNLARTTIEAPFDGRVRMTMVDVGQFVGAGTPLASIFSTDAAEVSLPLTPDEVAYVDLPLGFQARDSEQPAPPVTLTANIGGQTHEWQGRIVRTDAVIDERTRMVNVIARVDQPFDANTDDGRPPLAPGTFVQAKIEGREVENVAVIPRLALRDDGFVYVVDDENKLQFRQVSVLRRERDNLVINSGLQAGERICVSPFDKAVEGMSVRVPSENEGGSQR